VNQSEFVHETFHALAQPITALRHTVELALRKDLNGQAARQTLEDCLPLIDRLMQDLALFREIASLEKEPPIDSCDGQALLQSSVDEMSLVAKACGITLRLNAEPAAIVCHAPTLQRAIFILLDAVISNRTGRNRKISISLRRCEDEFLLEVRPGPPQGLRLELCRKLMQSAGGSALASAADSISIRFREGSPQSPAPNSADQKLLTSHPPVSGDTGVKDIA
jgi:light-regulated signal transduction histidine kinase (bacteriophytochrome)